jgi:hypothetical protein
MCVSYPRLAGVYDTEITVGRASAQRFGLRIAHRNKYDYCPSDRTAAVAPAGGLTAIARLGNCSRPERASTAQTACQLLKRLPA